MLLPGFEPSTSVSKTDILANRPIYSIAEAVIARELPRMMAIEIC